MREPDVFSFILSVIPCDVTSMKDSSHSEVVHSGECVSDAIRLTETGTIACSVGVAEIKPVLNPVIVNKVKSYSRSMLSSFISHNTVRLKEFNIVLTEMKNDYQEMYEMLPDASSLMVGVGMMHEVQYIEQEVLCQNPMNAGSKIASLSMGIKKGKYDGSDNSYKECT